MDGKRVMVTVLVPKVTVMVSPVLGSFVFSGNRLSKTSVALPPVVPICLQFGSLPKTSSIGTGFTTFKKASDALPCSRIACHTVGQEAIPLRLKNALILSASRLFFFTFTEVVRII